MNRSAVYSECTINSPSRIKRFSHRRRFIVAAEMVAPKDGDRILDYGAGDGYFLEVLRARNPHACAVGYEPQSYAVKPGLDIRSSITEASFDTITCLEVLEHLLPDDLSSALRDFKRLLKPDGQLIVSVPIEIGLPALGKNIFRFFVRQSEPGSSIVNIFRAGLGLRIDRPVLTNRYSHLGFDYRRLAATLRNQGLTIIERRYSPLPFGPLLNSQVLFRLKPQAAKGE